jgi:hypothetical protein
MLFHVSAFALSPEVREAFESFRPTQAQLQAYMAPKEYGEGVAEFYLGFICVSPAYNAFFTPKRDRYTKARTVTYKDGFEIVREKTFECEVRLAYEVFLTATVEEVRGLLTHEVLQAVQRLYKHHPKLNPFDIAAFSRDVSLFFTSCRPPT